MTKPRQLSSEAGRVPEVAPAPALERAALPASPIRRPLRALARIVRERLELAQSAEWPRPSRFGFQPDRAARFLVVTSLFRDHWFRVEPHGLENLPAGPFLLVANHGSHLLAWDGAMIVTVCLLDADPPRLVHGMADHGLMKLPVLGHVARQIGAVDGTRASCRALLRAGGVVLTFPEGMRALGKRFRDRYRLESFGSGFALVALETGVPIVPVAVIGAEEESPIIANLGWIARRLGIAVAPLSPTLVFPMPVKYRIHFGAPMHLLGAATVENAAREAVRVRGVLQDLLVRGVAARRHLFW
jgi:1-acyl-sn-glycerol-3-phosphate acyltransferase